MWNYINNLDTAGGNIQNSQDGMFLFGVDQLLLLLLLNVINHQKMRKVSCKRPKANFFDVDGMSRHEISEVIHRHGHNSMEH